LNEEKAFKIIAKSLLASSDFEISQLPRPEGRGLL